MATFVTDTLWFYYWYFLWPAAQDVLPVEISVSPDRGPLVRLAVSLAPETESAYGVHEDQLPHLREAFQREVAEPLREAVRMEIAFTPTETLHGRLNEPMDEDLVGGEAGYRTVFVGDLLHDLQSLLPPEAFEQWIHAPNARFGGAAPRALLGTPGQRLLRDIILEARHGLPT